VDEELRELYEVISGERVESEYTWFCVSAPYVTVISGERVESKLNIPPHIFIIKHGDLRRES